MLYLATCNRTIFTAREARNRKKVIRELQRLAATIEDIPAALKFRHAAVVRAALERGAGVREREVRVATLTAEDQNAMFAELQNMRGLYDSGRWLDLPTSDVGSEPQLSFFSRILWVSVALMSLAGIIAMVVLTATSVVPQSVGAPVPFALGLILYAALARLGLSSDAMKNAVEVSSKVQSALRKPAADAPGETSATAASDK